MQPELPCAVPLRVRPMQGHAWSIITTLVTIKVEMLCGGFLFCLFVVSDYYADVTCFPNVLIRVNLIINDEM